LGVKVAEFTTGVHPSLQVTEGESNIFITGQSFSIGFDKKEGTLSSWKFREVELIARGPLPNFRRAPTDNDVGNGMPRRCKVWFDASEKRTVVKTGLTNISAGEILITVQFAFPDSMATETVEYRVKGDGKITVSATVKPLREKLPELPRFGLNMQISPEFNKLSWYGRGPYENYCDRKTASFVGLYQSTVDGQFTPYIRPQENGYKTDVRWLVLENQKHMTILFSADSLISFSTLPYTYDDMKGFKQGGKHLYDLEKKPFVDLNIDYGQMGVGGDDSWGARTHEQYTLPAEEYGYGFTMEAVISSEVAR
jgi:beta-galactosidase